MVKGKRDGGGGATPETAQGSGTPPKRPRKGASDPVEKINTGAETVGEEPAIEESEGLKMAETLRGDIRDRLLAVIKAMTRVWAETDEAGQQVIAAACDFLAERMIFKTIEIVHAEGAPALRMSVDGVSFKKGIKVALSGSRGDPHRHLLADATDADVLVVLENAARFMGEKAPPKIDKDQGELDVDQSTASQDGAAQ